MYIYYVQRWYGIFTLVILEWLLKLNCKMYIKMTTPASACKSVRFVYFLYHRSVDPLCLSSFDLWALMTSRVTSFAWFRILYVLTVLGKDCQHVHYFVTSSLIIVPWYVTFFILCKSPDSRPDEGHLNVRASNQLFFQGPFPPTPWAEIGLPL